MEAAEGGFEPGELGSGIFVLVHVTGGGGIWFAPEPGVGVDPSGLGRGPSGIPGGGAVGSLVQ